MSSAGGAPCSRPLDTSSGDMDDLAAAAAVLAMTVESESDDGLELEDCRGCSSDNMSAQPEMEISDVDKENLNHFPMDQRIGAEVPNVSMQTRNDAMDDMNAEDQESDSSDSDASDVE